MFCGLSESKGMDINMFKKLKAKNLITGLVILCMILVTGCGNKSSSQSVSSNKQSQSTKTIVDMDGNSVKVPVKVTKVATSWPGFCNALFTVSGRNNKIVATSPAIKKSYPWAIKLYPQLKNISYPFNGETTNIEQLVKSKPDVAFLRKGDSIQKVKEAGIPVVMIDYKHNSIEDIINSVVITGKVLGENEYKKAEQYKDYFNKNISKVSSITSKIPENERPKVIYLSVQNESISVWGKNMPQNETINMVGAINEAANEIDGYKEVSMEQMLKWNPDEIIVDGNLKKSKVAKNPSWNQLKAVKDNKVFVSPSGIFSWARLGTESALQLLWMAKNIYPQKFQDIDIAKETKYFYKNFFGYELKDDEVKEILNCENPI
ncbi:Fe(3+)-citrate-binding protein YfmC precursor [Clostridium ljungdahlii]|uniref:Fe(3+)-citrate-binding protein YfmC n=1 Tax=Clostridium ljungdahlii TaxID=1538 RepID=A0A162J4Y9_9CLOT|nr:Fe(3+)-citrate-binding protein YfmC precursor [Clostridium ljungdahlii]